LWHRQQAIIACAYGAAVAVVVVVVSVTRSDRAL
jgi:hypothetical protein